MTEPQQSAEEAVAEVTYRAGERFYGTENAAKYWASREALIARLETAEQRAEKAEALIMKNPYRLVGPNGSTYLECRDCGVRRDSRLREEHKPSCLIAALEGRRAKETPKIDLPNGVLPTLETGR